MNLKEALEWADKNSADEAVNRLKSRKAVKVLAKHVKEYRLWIADSGVLNDTCTFHILGDVCKNCACNRKNLG